VGMWTKPDLTSQVTDPTLLAKFAVDAKDSMVRCAAVQRLTEQTALAKVAVEAVDSTVRRVAVQKLTDQAELAKVALQDEDSAIRIAAVEKLTDQTLLAKMGMWVKPDLVREATDQALLAKLAVQAKGSRVRCRAVKELADNALLAKVAVQDEDQEVRRAAAEKLQDKALLARAIVESKESLEWDNARTTNTRKSYLGYLSKYPRGRFVEGAKRKASALRADQAPYDAALQVGTEAALKAFLVEYPGHEMESDALQALQDIFKGSGIVDLLEQTRIEIKTRGSGIQSVSISVRRLVPYALTVRVPVGTYFVSAKPSSQNMVATEEASVRLTGEGWVDVSPVAACANRSRDIPSDDDTFTVRRWADKDELCKLVPSLSKAGTSSVVRQAAVWIVTDNANYDALGILVGRALGQIFGGTREINECEAAQAIRICHQAGIDVKRKSIWRDREKIVSGLPDGDLRTWLTEMK
jgi:hypothetical protein